MDDLQENPTEGRIVAENRRAAYACFHRNVSIFEENCRSFWQLRRFN
jgi:hypothetical protein